MARATYEQEQQQITDAIAQLPETFGLRAFPGKRYRLAPRASHFVSEGEVQLVVQAEMTADEQQKYHLQPWADFGRNTLAHLLRELTCASMSGTSCCDRPVGHAGPHGCYDGNSSGRASWMGGQVVPAMQVQAQPQRVRSNRHKTFSDVERDIRSYYEAKQGERNRDAELTALKVASRALHLALDLVEPVNVQRVTSARETVIALIRCRVLELERAEKGGR